VKRHDELADTWVLEAAQAGRADELAAGLLAMQITAATRGAVLMATAAIRGDIKISKGGAE